MSAILSGAIDCDVHPQVPGIKALVPYLDDYWQEMVEVRGIEGFESRSYPPLAPLTARPDWRGADGRAAESPGPVAEQLFGRWGESHAILNCLYGIQQIMDERLAAAAAGAVNAWIAKEWLDVEPRFRASIVVPAQNPELAVEEIERRARRPSVRPDSDAGDGRLAARAALLLADLCGGRAAWAARRDPSGQRLPAGADGARLAQHLCRGLCASGAGIPGPAREPRQPWGV